MSPRITLACDADVSAAVGCGVLCMVYRGRHRTEFPELFHGWALQAAAASRGTPLSAIGVVEDHADSPESKERKAYAEALQAVAPKFDRLAQIILSQGLKGSAYRAIASTIVLVARPSVPMKVFGATTEGAGWVAEVGSVSATELEAFIESVRAA